MAGTLPTEREESSVNRLWGQLIATTYLFWALAIVVARYI
jgi:hypothetical protein